MFLRKNILFNLLNMLIVILVAIIAFSNTNIQAQAELSTQTQDQEQDTTFGITLDDLDDSSPPGLDDKNDDLISSDVDYIEALLPVESSQIIRSSVTIPQLGERARSIFIYLPDGYLNSEIEFPVVYLLNAQEVFLPSPYSLDEWFIQSSMFTFFTSAFEGEAIIVGITDDFDHYWDEYSPWVNNQMHAWVDPWYAEQSEGGEGEAFLDFIVENLKPEIDLSYRTLPGREYTAIGGYDMGGLLSLYAGITRSDVFSSVMALSPAIWFAERNNIWLSDNQLIDLIKVIPLQNELTFYIEVGLEGEDIDFDVHPDIFNQDWEYISYPQAYIEGAQMVINTLRGLGLPKVQVISSISTIEQREEENEDELEEIIDPLHTYNFPVFLSQSQGMNNFEISMSPYLSRTRKIWVYLPPNYNTSDLSYPVLYVLDAIHQFNPNKSPNISAKDDWKTDEILDSLYSPTGFKGIIVVGIEHHPTTYRWSEYNRFNQYNMDNWVKDGSEVVLGEGDAFLNFIVKKLKPTIDTRYRTKTGRDYTAIAGGSRAGYLAINAGLTHSKTFSKVIALSPAIWLAEGGTQTDHPIWLSSNNQIKWINNNTVPNNVQFYIYVGGNEISTGSGYPFVYRTPSIDSKITYPEAYVEGAQAVNSALKNKGVTPIWRYRADGQHYAIYWRDPLLEALTLFGFYSGGN